jgi:hypothetical protein
MALRRERTRINPTLVPRAFLTMAALFAATTFTTPARAQEAYEPAGIVGLDGIDLRDRPAFGSFDSLGRLSQDVPRYNFSETTRTENETEETGESEIVVTARFQNEIQVTPHPDFTANIFASAGMTTNHNPENDGLELFPIRQDDREGWRGVDVELFDMGDRFSIEAQVKSGPGLEFTWRFGGD